MSILITGGSGLLGNELKKLIPECLTPSHDSLDITNKNLVSKFIKDNCIKKIIHTAAITSIRKCDDDKSHAWSVNVEGTQNLLSALREHSKNGYFVYVSTPCVFRGDDKMYDEQSIPDPVNFYGFTKSVGENIVKSFHNHLIVRTNFVAKKSWPYEKAFTDRFGNYLFSDDVALILSKLFCSEIIGIRHIVGNQILSMFELAKLTTLNIQPMNMKQYVGPHLTKNMTMNSIFLKKYNISSV